MADLKMAALDSIYEQEDLVEQFRVRLKFEFAPTETETRTTQ